MLISSKVSLGERSSLMSFRGKSFITEIYLSRELPRDTPEISLFFRESKFTPRKSYQIRGTNPPTEISRITPLLKTRTLSRANFPKFLNASKRELRMTKETISLRRLKKISDRLERSQRQLSNTTRSLNC